MQHNFRIKYWFEGLQYSSGVDDLHRDASVYHIYLPTELRSLPQGRSKFVAVIQQDNKYKLQSNTALSKAMFEGFMTYVNNHEGTDRSGITMLR